MIDEAWLDRRLHFDLPGGFRFEGLAGVGGYMVAINYVDPKGGTFVVKMFKDLFEFPCLVHEIPNWLAPQPMYDPDTLNRKLLNIVGDPTLHLIVGAYETFFSSIVQSFLAEDFADFDQVIGDSEESTDALQFVLATPPIGYRVEDIASRTDKRETRVWAEKALAAIARIGSGEPELRPKTLLMNPMFVWGGAVLSGFFTKSELAIAATAILKRLNGLPNDEVQAFLNQAVILVDGVRSLIGIESASRLAMLCDATGLFPWDLATEDDWAAPDVFLDSSILDTSNFS